MGWTNSHLHEFRIGDERYTHPKFMEDSFDDFGATNYSGITINDLVDKYGEQLKLRFLYDSGDCWEHDVVLEKIIVVEPNAIYPRCVEGQRACPPEDVGGVWGYVEFIEAISDPTHHQHEDMLEWSGPFDPDEFDPERATSLMAEGFPVWY